MARRAFSRDLNRFTETIDSLQGDTFVITSIDESDSLEVQILAIYNQEKYQITVSACNAYPFEQPEISIRKCKYNSKIENQKKEEQEIDEDEEDELEYFKDVIVKSPFEHWGLGWSSVFIWLFLDWFPENEIHFL